MSELELLVDLHLEGNRQGPGSTESTLKALNLTGLVDQSNLQIADIGCGTGASTMLLAEYTDSQITAVDLFPEFLDRLVIDAAENRLIKGITTKAESMDDLSFDLESLDLIWSEGAIYNIGFQNGAKYWRQFLKPGGVLAVSEISWKTNKRPTDIQDYWQSFYPEIDTIDNKMNVLETLGYKIINSFILPESCWEEEYYKPLEERYESFLDKHSHSKEAIELVSADREEIANYRKYKEYYGYAFYLVSK